MKDFTISQLSEMIRKDWQNIDSASEKCLTLMEQLNVYMVKDKEEVILDFLCGAINWKGNLSSQIKKELNKRLMEHG